MQVLGKLQVDADGSIILPDGRRIRPGDQLLSDAIVPFNEHWTAEEARANGCMSSTHTLTYSRSQLQSRRHAPHRQ